MCSGLFGHFLLTQSKLGLWILGHRIWNHSLVYDVAFFATHTNTGFTQGKPSMWHKDIIKKWTVNNYF